MNQQQISYYVAIDNGRPDKDLIPNDAPLELIYLMNKCWDIDPSTRPCFETIIKYLRNIINKASM